MDEPQRWLAISGFGILVIGLSWVSLARLPVSGPDIGGGLLRILLWLLAYFAIAGGVMLVVGYEIDCRRTGRRLLDHGISWWTAMALVLVLGCTAATTHFST